MDITWTDVLRFVKPGMIIKHIGQKGYTGSTFTITGMTNTKFTLRSFRGISLEVFANDFDKTRLFYNASMAGEITSSATRAQSGKPVYIFAIIHAFQIGVIRRELRFDELLRSDSKVFVKSDFAPISSDWPAISFSASDAPNRLTQEAGNEKDFLLTVGTANSKNTPAPEHRSACLSIARIGDKGPIRSELVIPPAELAKFQGPGRARFQYSLEPLEVWTVRDFNSVKTVLPQTYKTIGLFRDSYTRLLKDEIERARDLILVKTSISSVVTSEERDIPQNSLNLGLARLLILARRRAAKSGFQEARRFPDRTVNLSLNDLLRKWSLQEGRCGLCQQTVPEPTDNYLLQMSLDRRDSSNPKYDFENSQITHLGCNLGKNVGSAQEFSDWLGVIRQAHP